MDDEDDRDTQSVASNPDDNADDSGDDVGDAEAQASASRFFEGSSNPVNAFQVEDSENDDAHILDLLNTDAAQDAMSDAVTQMGDGGSQVKNDQGVTDTPAPGDKSIAAYIRFGGINSGNLTWQIWLPSGLTGFLGTNGQEIDIAIDEVTQTNTNSNWYTLNNVSWGVPSPSDTPKTILVYANPDEGGTSAKTWPVDGNFCKARFGTTVPSGAQAGVQYGLVRVLAVVNAKNPTVATLVDTGERNGTGYMGDGDVTPGGPASITTIAPGLLQLVGWTGSAGSAVDLKGGTNSPVLYSKDSNGVGQLVVLTDSSAGYEGASDSDSDSIGPQDITTGTPAGGTAWSQTADGPSASGKQLILKLSVLSYDTAYGSGWHRMDVTLTFHADGRLASCSGFSDGSNIQTVEPL